MVSHLVRHKESRMAFWLKVCALCYLHNGIGQRRREVSSVAWLHKRYLPHPEEAQNVVYPVGIKEVGEIFQSPSPPQVVILCHLFPIICWEPPVLALCGEGIGRSASLNAKIEELRVLPTLCAITRQSYRKVSLKCNAFGVGILFGRAPLQISIILQEIVEIYLLLRQIISFAPLAILCRAIHIP